MEINTLIILLMVSVVFFIKQKNSGFRLLTGQTMLAYACIFAGIFSGNAFFPGYFLILAGIIISLIDYSRYRRNAGNTES